MIYCPGVLGTGSNKVVRVFMLHSHAEKGERPKVAQGVTSAPFIEALIPLGRMEPLGLVHFLKTIALNTAALGIKFWPEF